MKGIFPLDPDRRPYAFGCGLAFKRIEGVCEEVHIKYRTGGNYSLSWFNLLISSSESDSFAACRNDFR